MKKLKIKKGDTVYINAGNDKGKTGKVLAVDTEKNRAIVEGINMVSKHTKPNSKNPQGGIVKQEAGVHVSNLQVVDPVKGGPTKIGRRLNDKGKLVRYAKKSGEEIKYWPRKKKQQQSRRALRWPRSGTSLPFRRSIRKRSWTN